MYILIFIHASTWYHCRESKQNWNKSHGLFNTFRSGYHLHQYQQAINTKPGRVQNYLLLVYLVHYTYEGNVWRTGSTSSIACISGIYSTYLVQHTKCKIQNRAACKAEHRPILPTSQLSVQQYSTSTSLRKRQLWVRPIWVVDTQLCRLCDTSVACVCNLWSKQKRNKHNKQLLAIRGHNGHLRAARNTSWSKRLWHSLHRHASPQNRLPAKQSQYSFKHLLLTQT